MFSNEFVGIFVLIATFTVGLSVGWKFWGQAAKKAVDDQRELEQDVVNERRKNSALQHKVDAAQVEIETHKKRVAELEANVSSAPVPVDDGAGKAALEAMETARNEADARAQLAEARALEAEKRLSENEQHARAADTLLKKVEARVDGRAEIEEAKAKREAEAKAKADAEAKAKADAEAAAEAKAVVEAKADAEAKALAEAEAAKANAKPEGVPDAFWAMFGNKVPVAAPGAKDELVGHIKGIGPITGKRLNDLGIFTYAQLAAFDSEIVARVAVAVGAMPAKADKDDWPGQAKKKLEGPKT